VDERFDAVVHADAPAFFRLSVTAVVSAPASDNHQKYYFNPRGKLVDNLESKFKIIYRHHPARSQCREHKNMEISADTHMQAPTRSPRPTGIKAFHQHNITID
jgi:hypothetical protein